MALQWLERWRGLGGTDGGQANDRSQERAAVYGHGSGGAQRLNQHAGERSAYHIGGGGRRGQSRIGGDERRLVTSGGK
jgi:hypothetical protein